jgi:hypothetical protein
VLYSGGDGLPQEVGGTASGRDSQTRGVEAQSCGVRALNARACEQERAFSPRARRTSPEGAFSPRKADLARGAFSCAPLAGRGGPRGLERLLRAFLGSWISSCFAFFTR